MEKKLIEQIKKYVTEMQSSDSQKNLRKGGYVDGYVACCKDIQNIISMAESLMQ